MGTPPAPDRPDGRRTAAAWVAATGAFLLVAAAVTFTAVRWDDIPDEVKLAVIAAATGASLLAGRAFRTTLPATSGVVFHLGALLLPVDVAALGVHLGLGWRGLVLAEGLTCTAAFVLLARLERSIVLSRAAVAAAAVLAAGLAGPTGVPAPLLLAVAGVAAHLATRWTTGDTRADLDRAALAWAAVAGTAPLIASVEATITTGREVLTEIGLVGDTAGLLALVTGGLAALVLGRTASQRSEPVLALLAVLSMAVGLGTTWTELAPQATTTAVGLAALFVAVEVAALAARGDGFWAGPLHVLGVAAEAVAGAATVAATVAVILAGSLSHAELTDRLPLAVASGLLGVGWLAADLRRGERSSSTTAAMALLLGGGFAPATPAIVVAAGAATALSTTSATATGVVLVVAAAVAVAGARPLSAPVAAVVAVSAPALCADTPAMAMAVGMAGALITAWAAAVRWVGDDDTAPTVAVHRNQVTHAALALTATGAGVGTVVAQVATIAPGGPWAAMAGAVAGWTIAVVLDTGHRVLGHIARLAVGALAFAAVDLPPGAAALVTLVIAVLAVVEAVRLDDVRIALAASLLAPVVLACSAVAAGISVPATGLAVCVTAAVWLGLAALAGADEGAAGPWQLPLGAAAATCSATGIVLAAGDVHLLGHSLLVTGVQAVAAGVVLRRDAVAHVGGLALIAGTWVHLAAADVGWSEAYVVPVALHLVAAGVRARRTGDVSSWVAYGPAVALAGGTGLAERIAGGSAGHALWTGVVAVIAVAVGGQRRLAAPLLGGTGLVVAVAVHESLAWSAGIPTWGWLAAGGAVLLGAGIAMDRATATPVEVGRRMVDVIHERFQ